MSDQAGNVLCLASGPGPEAGKVPAPCLWGGVQILAFLFEGILKGRGSPNFLPQEVEEIEQNRGFKSQVVSGNRSQLGFPICEMQVTSLM